jgi:leucyl-tRNA synthetase
MEQKMKKYQRILVTSALPYANGPIHLGHLAGAYLPADVYVRYQRKKKRDVLYICGSDEHGVPITIAAEKQKRARKKLSISFIFATSKLSRFRHVLRLLRSHQFGNASPNQPGFFQSPISQRHI